MKGSERFAMSFRFRFASILKLRKLEQELQQQAVAQARHNLKQCLDRQQHLVHERQSVLHEIRQLNDSDTWDVDQVLVRQSHADRLTEKLALTDQEVTQAKSELDARLQLLLIADQAFRAFEKLAERHFEEHRRSMEKSAALQ
jgi:flagellar biosynthesis chaperone FliJ